MNGRNATRDDALDDAVIAAGNDTANQDGPSRWEARLEIERHRAESERLQLLIEFLSRPVHAHGGEDPDPDVITAYNLAVEAALNGIRRAASVPSLSPRY